MKAVYIFVVSLSLQTFLLPYFEYVISSCLVSYFLRCKGVEMFKKSMDFGQAGDNVGALLRGVKRDDVQRGQVLAQPGTVRTYKKFEVSLPSHLMHAFI